jgi:ABC-type spermidine/putrescine transport system permease subunit II
MVMVSMVMCCVVVSLGLTTLLCTSGGEPVCLAVQLLHTTVTVFPVVHVVQQDGARD